MLLWVWLVTSVGVGVKVRSPVCACVHMRICMQVCENISVLDMERVKQRRAPVRLEDQKRRGKNSIFGRSITLSKASYSALLDGSGGVWREAGSVGVKVIQPLHCILSRPPGTAHNRL